MMSPTSQREYMMQIESLRATAREWMDRYYSLYTSVAIGGPTPTAKLIFDQWAQEVNDAYRKAAE